MKLKFIILVLLLFTLGACQFIKTTTNQGDVQSFKDHFRSNSKFNKNWEDDSYKSPASYFIEDGHLKITTRPQLVDRVKVKTKRNDFGLGTYSWRIYIPQFDLFDQCAIGAFLYHSGDINYEFDFEIGSGTKTHRDELNANLSEVLVHCTSQIAPFSNHISKIESEEWHEFTIELKQGFGDKYLIMWYIDGVLVKTLQSDIKTDIKFTVHNSIENLDFMGEQLPTRKNYVLFDWFEYRP